jgi:hypothetical protein
VRVFYRPKIYGHATTVLQGWDTVSAKRQTKIFTAAIFGEDESWRSGGLTKISDQVACRPLDYLPTS